MTLLFIITYFCVAGNIDAGYIFLSPKSGDLIYNCKNKLDIIIDTNGKEINTIDVKILNSKSFSIDDFFVKNGIFSQYIKPKISKIRNIEYKKLGYTDATYIMGTSGSSRSFVGTGIFGSIILTPRSTDKINVEFYTMTGYNGDDTNMISFIGNKIIDILEHTANGEYSIQKGDCPTIDGYNGQDDDSTIIFNTDNQLNTNIYSGSIINQEILLNNKKKTLIDKILIIINNLINKVL